MGITASRIRRLEEMLGVGARVIVVGRPRDMTDAELEAFLHAQGISTASDDLIVSLHRFEDGDPEPWVKIAAPAH